MTRQASCGNITGNLIFHVSQNLKYSQYSALRTMELGTGLRQVPWLSYVVRRTSLIKPEMLRIISYDVSLALTMDQLPNLNLYILWWLQDHFLSWV